MSALGPEGTARQADAEQSLQAANRHPPAPRKTRGGPRPNQTVEQASYLPSAQTNSEASRCRTEASKTQRTPVCAAEAANPSEAKPNPRTPNGFQPACEKTRGRQKPNQTRRAIERCPVGPEGTARPPEAEPSSSRPKSTRTPEVEPGLPGDRATSRRPR